MVNSIKRLWNNEQTLRGAAGLLVVTMLLSNILGFLRDVILANTIPLPVLDTYYAAFRIPDFLFNLFILGAISSAFIPVFLDIKAKDGDARAWKMAHNLAHTSLLVLVVFGVILYVLMPQLLPYFVPGFDPSRSAETAQLARILLISPIFFSISYIIGGVLNAHKKFFAYSLAPLVYNISIIIGGFLSPQYGITGVAWAVVIGAALHMVVQLPVLRGLNYKYFFTLNFFDKDLIHVIRLMIPRSISLGMSQIVLLFFTRIGSQLPSGSVSIFSLTNNFQTTPVAIFAASIATAVFPMLGSASSEKKDDEFKHLLTDSLKGMFYFMIPSTVLFWVLRAHLIRLFLALNHQTWEDTLRAIATFQWFILALAAQGFNLILIRAFYARQDTVRPMVISIIGGLLSVGFAYYFAGIMQDVPALSLGFLVGTAIESVLLFIVFQAYHKKLIDIPKLVETITASVLFSVAAGLAARIILGAISDGAILHTPGFGTEKILPLFIALVGGGVAGSIVYLLFSLLFKREELYWILPKRAVRAIMLPDSESVAANEGVGNTP